MGTLGRLKIGRYMTYFASRCQMSVRCSSGSNEIQVERSWISSKIIPKLPRLKCFVAAEVTNQTTNEVEGNLSHAC